MSKLHYKSRQRIEALEQARQNLNKKGKADHIINAHLLKEEQNLHKLSVPQLRQKIKDKGLIIKQKFFMNGDKLNKASMIKGLLKIAELPTTITRLEKFQMKDLKTYNKKFDVYKIIGRNIHWRKSDISKLIWNEFQGLERRDNIYLSMGGFIVTKTEEGDDVFPQETNMLKTKMARIQTEEDAKRVATELIQKNNEHIRKLEKKSDINIEITYIRKVMLNFKYLPNFGRGYISISKELEEFLYNPTSNNMCFFEALREYFTDIGQEFLISEICHKLGIHGAVSTKNISKIVNAVDDTMRIELYSLKDDYNLKSPTKYPYSGKRDHICKLFLHKNHYFLITNFKMFIKHQFKPEDFEEPKEEETTIEDITIKNLPVKHQERELIDSFENCYTYDLETHTNESDSHEIFASGLTNFNDEQNAETFYGYLSPEKLVERMEELGNIQRERFIKYVKEHNIRSKYALKSIKERFTLKFFAHNGGRYDSYLIRRYIKSINAQINSNGILMLSFCNGFVILLDSYRHLSSPLEQLCKDFKLPQKYRKTTSPYDFINETKDIYYKGQVPDKKYWKNNIIPTYIDQTKEYDYEKHTTDYLKLDLISLAMILKMYATETMKVTGLNPLQFLTAPSLAYHYTTKTWQEEFGEEGKTQYVSKKDEESSEKLNEYMKDNKYSKYWNKNKTQQVIMVAKNKEVDSFIRDSIIGGRVFVQKEKFVSPQYTEEFEEFNDIEEEDKQKLYDKVETFLHDFDATSLYPSAMYLFKLPCGKAYKVLKDDFNTLKAQINSLSYKKHCIMKASIKYKNEKKYCTAVLPSRQKGRVIYDVRDKIVTATSVDIMEAIKHNDAYIDEIYECIEWKESAFLFKRIIGELFNARLKAKAEGNEAMSQAIKIIMNSIYGGLIKRIMLEQTEIITDKETLDKKLVERDCWFQCNDDHAIIGYERDMTENDIKRPAHLGVFILAYSKKIMNNCVELFDGFTDWENTFYYTDTDSMIITDKVYKQLLKSRIEYPLLDEPQQMVSKNLGGLHSDLDLESAKIIRGIWISLKLYILEYIGMGTKDCVVCGKNEAKYGKYQPRRCFTCKKQGDVSHFINCVVCEKKLAEYGSNSAKRCIKCKKDTDERLFYINILKKKYHARSKGVTLSNYSPEELYKQYEDMMEGKAIEYETSRFAKESFKNPHIEHGRETGIQTIKGIKVINRQKWNGREYDEENNRFVPFSNKKL